MSDFSEKVVPGSAGPVADLGSPRSAVLRLRVILSNQGVKPQQIQLISCRPDRGGNVQVRYLVPLGAKPEFQFIDEFENVHAARSVEPLDRQLTNITGRVDGATEWEFKAVQPSFHWGRNLSPEWSLRGHDTFYMGSEGAEPAAVNGAAGVAGRAVLRAPGGGDLFALKPGAKYRFSLLGALHRCGGLVRVSFIDRTGDFRRLATRRIARSASGGSEQNGYDPVVLEFIVPSNGSVRISVEKSETESGADSYVFLACPALQEVSTQATACEYEGTFANCDANHELREAIIFPPLALLKAEGCTVLRMRVGDQAVEQPVQLALRTSSTEIAAALGAGLVRFDGQNSADEKVELAVYVDGQMSNRGEFLLQDERFSGTLLIDPSHLDGRPHRIELRSGNDHALLASWTEVLPAHLTPWTSLQNYARGPLGIVNAPAAPHHFRAYRRWLAEVEGMPVKQLPPLVRLHNTLIEGIQKRRNYEALEFPVCGAPLVSIVVPVHDKFEVTYFGLSALLFAHNHASFEVIVVDDGSTDMTLAIRDIVSGVTVVRHEQAQGFVGACNAGAEAAAGEYIAFLNNDTEVTAGWLDELVDTFENFDNVGLAGSKLVYPDGRLQEAGGIVWRSGNPWNVGRNGNAEDPSFNYLRQVDYLSGAAILMQRELFNSLGQFSREFAPAYFEDTDLAMKVRQEGKRVVYVPTSIVYHYEGQSAGTDLSSGMKRFQEVNRPKFKRKWVHLYSGNGEEGARPEREKDRNVGFRVLFVDYQVPLADQDAGSYAAFQEIRLLQGLGGKVTFLPRNLAWLDRHTLALERIGVECLYAPYVLDFAEYLAKHAADYDLVYVCRYSLAQEAIPLVRGHAATKIAFNVADLHFLRELREASSGNPTYSFEGAATTRTAELEQIAAADLTLSYSDVEMAVVQSHLGPRARTAKIPWVLDVPPTPLGTFESTQGALFLGSFGHPPNVRSVEFFARQVLPRVREQFPNFQLRIVGAQLVDSVRSLESDAVEIVGHVANLDEVFRATRVFVAPLLAGAGIKGKVLEAAARGVPSVLSRIAAEGTDLVDGIHCLIADNADSWVQAVARLNSDRDLWNTLAVNVQENARASHSFEKGLDSMAEALARLDIYGRRDTSLVYRHARPHKYGLD